MDLLRAHRGDRASTGFKQALDELRMFAEAGDISVAEELADQLALLGANRDPEEAYKWYYIALSQQGYRTAWEDHNHTPPDYCGPVGDFRNEPMVADLVVELGWQRVRELDEQAAQWLANRRGKTGPR